MPDAKRKKAILNLYYTGICLVPALVVASLSPEDYQKAVAAVLGIASGLVGAHWASKVMERGADASS